MSESEHEQRLQGKVRSGEYRPPNKWIHKAMLNRETRLNSSRAVGKIPSKTDVLHPASCRLR